jgi:hypothetical protein
VCASVARAARFHTIVYLRPKSCVWLTSTNTMVAELVHDWATPQGMKLVPLIAATRRCCRSIDQTILAVAARKRS